MRLVAESQEVMQGCWSSLCHPTHQVLLDPTELLHSFLRAQGSEGCWTSLTIRRSHPAFEARLALLPSSSA